MLHLQITSTDATEHLARDLAQLLPPRSVVLLEGDLGAGKTVFARAMIRARTRHATLEVASPTFNLVYTYETPAGSIAHFDLYRLKDPSEIEEIGFDDALAGNLTIVEWPDRLGARGDHLKRAVRVRIDLVPENPTHRQIMIEMSNLKKVPEAAFVFAAGLGNRMRPLTDVMPKPLVPVNGKPVLSYMIDMLHQAGVKRLVMNTHHLADQMNVFADGYRDQFGIQVSHEPELLETGGGLKAAMPLFADDIFYAVNGDSPLIDGPGLPAFARLAAAFDPEQMDILLLLQPNAHMITPWVGDYHINDDGRLIRALDQKGTQMFTGVRIMHRRVMDHAPLTKHSFREQMDAAQAAGRLFGLVHDGEWHHLTTPQDVDLVGAYLQQKQDPA